MQGDDAGSFFEAALRRKFRSLTEVEDEENEQPNGNDPDASWDDDTFVHS